MRLYKQITPFTCGPSCALMVLHHYFNTKFSKENELEIWKKMMAIPFKITLPLTLSNFLLEKNLKVNLISNKLKVEKKGCQICFKYENIQKEQQDNYFKIFNYYYNKIQLKKFRVKGEWIKKVPEIFNIKNGLILALIDTYLFDQFLNKKRKLHVPDWVLVTKEKRNLKVYSPWYKKIIKPPIPLLQKSILSTEKEFNIPSSILLVNKK